jgi:hypothetical protein
MRRHFASLVRSRRSIVLPLLVAGASLLALASCRSNLVGRQCFIPSSGEDGGIPSTIVASPALECQSRMCLHIPAKSPDLCTAECDSDSDCDTSPESPCESGFVCAVPTVVGNFCCKKLCICRDYLDLPDGGVPPVPAGCDSTNALNECCNLPGRRENPTMYPGCR